MLCTTFMNDPVVLFCLLWWWWWSSLFLQFLFYFLTVSIFIRGKLYTTEYRRLIGIDSPNICKMGDEFQSFYHEVKSIEKADSKYTSENQITRLLRPGSTYANLNPFEVLLVDPSEPVEQAKKQYKKLSILLHPDKNPNDRERAQKAFDALNKAYKLLEDEKSRGKALEVVEEAKFKVNQTIDEKRKKLRAENKKDIRVDEDDPEKYKQTLRVMTMKLFAEYERKRRLLEDRAQEERKRKREEELEEEKAKEMQNEWQKNFEESRQNRVTSWHNFNKKTKQKRKDIRPPKHKAEARN